ncbi:lytic transglycosylase domain-containing protein [Croceicoccus sp. F390]|uniref:Lytic transglycosylase domain-containing protein n=1 Tax=Croceicoccus esteveae TaxID=3075597 RepID=A0ABU2ZIR1_9SPHN|nr:lytic transglycosylase domain-containing protein [Croceicoccus sp. F390]MDT0575297.1 lytic transglycosylase domain-containing protein [Croceicoccus sp. F390]
MIKARALLVAAILPLAGLTCQPASAGTTTAQTDTAPRQNVPAQLDAAQRAFYADVFSRIDAQDWGNVTALLQSVQGDPLHQLALARYYLHPDSPAIDLDTLSRWLAVGSDLPQAEQIGRLAVKRGLATMPNLRGARRLVPLRAPAKRNRPPAGNDGSMPPELSAAILERIKNDDPAGAHILLDGIDAVLTPQARAEWRQRVAWSYYIENDDANALSLARQVGAGGAGPWIGEGYWVAGLAAWRLGDCELAGDGFARAVRDTTNDELLAAAHYWHSRALVRCRQPEAAAPALRSAAQLDETLYGMLAAEQLNMTLPQSSSGQPFTAADWRQLSGQANVRTAIALVEIGREALADEVLRHQARIGDPEQYPALSRLARALQLPATQLYMAYNAPRDARADPATRYPAAKWQPLAGWKVDPALAYAHTLQESNFRADAISPANAVGLMQITPITVRQHAPSLGMDALQVDLADPATNMAFGQRNLEMLRDAAGTQGLLPKIMAAYNAGLAPITRWNTEVRDAGDPLLYMESIPYWETRAYVAIVTRNYWMYQRQQNTIGLSRNALAQNLWPHFPSVTGSGAFAMHGKPVLSVGYDHGG